MRTLIFSLLFMATAVSLLKAQEPKKYTVQIMGEVCMVCPDIPIPDVPMDEYPHTLNKRIGMLFKEAINKLPHSVKEKVLNKRIIAHLYFNARGEVYYVIFSSKSSMYDYLLGIDWMSISKAIKGIKIDMSDPQIPSNFKSSRTSFPFTIFK